MINVRRSVFETNSSSVHSITFDGNCKNTLHVSCDGYVHVELEDFGRCFHLYEDSHSKLAYLLLMVAHSNEIYFDGFDPEATFESSAEELYCTSEFKQLEHDVKRFFASSSEPCNGIQVDESYGHIDHQSLCYSSFSEWLEEMNIKSTYTFIFGNGVLITDGD